MNLLIMEVRAWLVGVLVIGCVSAAQAAPAASPRYAPAESGVAEQVPLDSYELDAVPRRVSARGKFVCPDGDLVGYRGTSIPFHKSVRMHRAFVPRVQEFEKVVIDVATKFYGRAPTKLRHLGAYVCRRMRRFPTYLSEHALGDALDLEGFDFAPVSKAARATTPKNLRGRLSVRIVKDWTATKGVGAVHAKFLRALADALIARPDIFRLMLGPSYPGHQNHFHLDGSNFRSIEF